jgi:acetyl esterase/lipase
MICLLVLLSLAPTGAAPAEALCEVEIVKDIAYRDDKDTDAERYKLDLYLPKGRKDFPVLFFVHGGGWKSGDKSLFAFLGKALAGHGIGMVSTNYRLFPKVKFPDNVKDVATAFAWTRKNIGRYGGCADRLFVGGHSTGGHLVSLLALDESYLKAQGLKESTISGVVSISGLYAIPKGRFPLFEDSEEAAKKASPIAQVKGKHPPFLLVYADGDFPRFGDMAEDFAKALREAKCEVQCIKVKDRTHGSVALKIAEDGDPVQVAIRQLIQKHGTKAAERGDP